jgi:2-polyprenyl-3-methyl-5-hydroxy-6-metoxy-1,4-benzoquinol methylase
MQSASSEIRTQPSRFCFLCGSPGLGLYQELPDILFGASGHWNLKRCQNSGCGLIWLDPMPVEEDLHLAYQTYFTHAQADHKRNFAKEFRKLLYRLYNLVNYPVNILSGLKEPKDKIKKMYLNDVAPGRLLDVGCGDGTFLSRMRNFGWSVNGVDFDKKAIENAKLLYNLELHHGNLESARFPGNSFDAITLSHVIEHVPDPVALLSDVYRLLKPGGRMVLTTPNADSLGHQKFRKYWFGLDPPRHLHVFTINSLLQCAKRTNLVVEQALSTAANADIFIGGSYSIRETAKRGLTERRTLGISVFRVANAIYWQYQELLGLNENSALGEEAVLICAKRRD